MAETGHLEARLEESFFQYYAPITTEKVDGLLAIAEDEARNAEWSPDIYVAERLSSKIGYDVAERVKKIGESYERAQVVRFQSNIRKEVEAVYQSSMKLDFAFYYPREDGIVSALESTGIDKQIERLIKFLPKVSVPEDLREKIEAVFGLYMRGVVG